MNFYPIGFLAKIGEEVFSNSDSCIVSGTYENLRIYLSVMSKSISEYSIRSVGFTEIIYGLSLGLSYDLDRLAYIKFFEECKCHMPEEINSVFKHPDQMKGRRMMRLFFPGEYSRSVLEMVLKKLELVA
jgi:hypothetical protein